MSIAQTVWRLLKCQFSPYKAKRGACSPPFLGGGLEKFLVRHSKVVSKTSLNPKNHVYSSNGMAVTEMPIFTVLGQKGGMPPPLLGGVEKFLVRHSKAMPKRGLNPENHVYISNGMVVTEMSIFTV